MAKRTRLTPSGHADLVLLACPERGNVNGLRVIRSEKRSGTSAKDRAELKTVLDFLRHGDVLTVTRIERILSGLYGRKERA